MLAYAKPWFVAHEKENMIGVLKTSPQPPPERRDSTIPNDIQAFQISEVWAYVLVLTNKMGMYLVKESNTYDMIRGTSSKSIPI